MRITSADWLPAGRHNTLKAIVMKLLVFSLLLWLSASSAEQAQEAAGRKDKRALDSGLTGHGAGLEHLGDQGPSLGGGAIALGHPSHEERGVVATVITKKIPVTVPKPYVVEVERKVPYVVQVPVEVPVHVPYQVPVPRPYHVPVKRPVPVAVERPLPYPVKVPLRVESPQPVHVPQPQPLIVHVPKRVHVPVPRPILVTKRVPIHVGDH
ncbi:tetra-peptide repeat homeobox protein 1-like [Bacillus rossius redtenbacheri]|uniref:tetra-peptide repeat homeobox protein 1-like n=1 Tax=Bacillus rossius redtenbacheri TaxID=93214 RepID=UPI002FDD9719